MGEPAGIGPDVILMSFAQRHALELPPFVVYGNLGFLAARARRLGLDLAFEAVQVGRGADVFSSALPVVHVDGLVSDNPGEASPLSGKVVIECIRRAVAETMTGAARGVVTAPIHKAALYAAGFKHPGHTEFLAELSATKHGVPTPVMMLVRNELRVVPATIHVPLRDVPRLLTQDLLVRVGKVVAHDLRTRFDVDHPRIAFTGLNPHAGEAGAMGTEELDVIKPAIAELAFQKIDVVGPIPADTLFHRPHWRRYDAVIAMYHDQALIPIKTVAFDDAVNITLGLPFVRTSPDHGTAFDLAGTGKASTASFLAALKVADQMTNGMPAQQAAQ
jgi:4-hydroxythreonine-4-phosphate dehydrogenase